MPIELETGERLSPFPRSLTRYVPVPGFLRSQARKRFFRNGVR